MQGKIMFELGHLVELTGDGWKDIPGKIERIIEGKMEGKEGPVFWRLSWVSARDGEDGYWRPYFWKVEDPNIYTASSLGDYPTEATQDVRRAIALTRAIAKKVSGESFRGGSPWANKKAQDITLLYFGPRP